MASLTYAGTTLAIANALPATDDQAGYEALAWDAGECALQGVPGIMREWAKVTETLVCKDTNSSVKGAAQWQDMTFTFSDKPGDAAQAIYTALEATRDGVGSFRMILPGNAGTIYFQAQVSKFSLTEGGGQNDIVSKGVELLIQTTPVFVPAP